jgi:hypothetical protein
LSIVNSLQQLVRLAFGQNAVSPDGSTPILANTGIKVQASVAPASDALFYVSNAPASNAAATVAANGTWSAQAITSVSTVLAYVTITLAAGTTTPGIGISLNNGSGGLTLFTANANSMSLVYDVNIKFASGVYLVANGSSCNIMAITFFYT